MQQPAALNAEPIPGYRLIERLGRGGYGEVWKAEAPGGMHKAIKFVYGDMDGVGDDGKAAEQEFRSLNRVKTIRHPFLLSLERIEIIDGQLVIVMELADRNLWDRFTECNQNGLPGIPRPELIRYLEEAAEALDLMNFHHQIQHLDIKPQNIFLVHRHVKVADFGLAKDLEGTRGELTGGITPMYAPPETFEQWVSRQSDQYSLAIVYTEMLTGRRPFNGTTTRQLIMQHMMAAPDLSPLPSPDREAVARALAKKPDDRFRSCMDFVRAIKGEIPSGAPAQSNEPSSLPAAAPADTPSFAACSTQRLMQPRDKSLPALVTPRSKVFATGSVSLRKQTPAATPIRRTITPVERIGGGVLFPALIVGIGGIGLASIRNLRQLIADRFGKSGLPHLRWLFVDTDPSTVESARTGAPEVALSADEVLLTRLHRASHYLSHESLPPVDSWLPSEDLYAIPRTPATEGIRSIGRLAICDHYHIVCHRIRTALEPFLSAAGVEEADRRTGLGVRSTFPRIYVVTSLTGGTGSGMFLDLTYLIRREVGRLGFGGPHAIGILGIPGPNDDRSNQLPIANSRAALMELECFGRPETPYRAQFDVHEKAIEDPERAFRRCTLVRLPEKQDSAMRERAASTMAHIAFGELLCPLGSLAYPDASTPPENPLSVVGIQRIVWPRNQVLRAAGWSLARKTLAAWLSKDLPAATTAPSEFIEGQWAERKLDRMSLRTALETHLVATLGVSPQERIANALRALADEANSDSAPMARVRATFRKLSELFGLPGPDERESSSAVGSALATRVKELAVLAESKLTAMVISHVEQPGIRLAGAEEATRVIRSRINDELRLADREAAEIEEEARLLFLAIHHQLVAPGSDTSFRGNYWTSVAEASGPLRHWATARLQGLLARACASVYRVLLGNLPDCVRELNLIRAQLTGFAKQLDEAAPAGLPQDGVCLAVYPDAAANVHQAAKNVLKAIGPEEMKDFENALQARVRRDCRSIVEVCNRPKDLGPGFVAVLIEQAYQFLEARAPKLRTFDALARQLDDSESLTTRVKSLLMAAAPDGLGKVAAVMTVLGLPEGASQIAELVREMCHGDVVRIGASPDDIVVWRESRGLKLRSFTHLDAENTSLPATEGRPNPSAHSRCDVDWDRTP
jgi:eukaryotic-like serine/threonine-protein kinase